MPAIQNKSRWKSLLCRPDWLLALALTAFVLWLHIYFLLHAGGFWRDEVNLIDLAGTHSFSQMERDSFPILMPLLVSVWSAFVPAHSDIGLRLLGTLIGLGIPAALWLVAWRARRAPPVLGLALLALNFTFILYGDSIRGYGLGSLMIVLTVFAACAFLKTPDWKRTALFTALATLSAQALYQNAAFVAAICFAAWAVCLREKNWQAVAKIFIVAAISAASLLPYFAQIASLPNASVSLRSGFDPQLIRINLDNALGLPLEQYVWIWAVLALVIFGCAIVSAVSGMSRRSEAKGEAVTQRTALAVTLASAFGVSWFIAAPETRWYFFPIIIGAVIYLDSGHWLGFLPKTTQSRADAPMEPAPDHLPLFAGVTLLTGLAAAACFEVGLPRTLHSRAAVFGLAVTTVLGAGYFARADLGLRMTNIDLIAQQVSAQAAPGDFVIVSPWYAGITFSRYYQGLAAWNTVPPLTDHTIHRYDLVLAGMKTPDALRPLYDKISATLQSGHRVWIVGLMDLPKPGPLPAALLLPPLPSTGWADRPYDIAWGNQVAQFLADHCAKYGMAYETTNQSVNFSECLKLYSAQGWSESPKKP
jgi:hypothetical protein